MTDREIEVAPLIVQGLTNVEIAAELFITPNTAEHHLRNIYANSGSAGATNRAASRRSPPTCPA